MCKSLISRFGVAIVVLILIILIITNYSLVKNIEADSIIPLNSLQVSSIRQISHKGLNCKKARLYFVSFTCRSCINELNSLSIEINNLSDKYDIYIISTMSNYQEVMPQNLIQRIKQKDGVFFIWDKERVYFNAFQIKRYPSVFEIDKPRYKMRIIRC